MKVYVCAPFASGAALRRELPDRLRAVGVTLLASWLDAANGAEDFSIYTAADLRFFAACNDRDLRSADAALVVDPDGAGRETYSEARLALEWGKPVVWYGRQTLSAWRAGVVRVESLDAALVALGMMNAYFAEGVRGELLALLVGGPSAGLNGAAAANTEVESP